jgi:hypothetical protein
MRRLFVLLSVLFIAGITAQAQDYPTTEIFGGYSYLNTNPTGDRDSFHGWGASFAGNLSERWGFVADFSGAYKTFESPLGDINANVYHFLFGPQVTARSKRASAFAHFLLGGSRGKFGGFTDTGFAMGFGGGADVNLGQNFALRVIQADYIPHRIGGQWNHDGRVQAGIVLKF